LEALLKQVKKKILELESVLKEIDEFQKHAPQGSLKLLNRNHHTFYYQQYMDTQMGKLIRKYIKKEDGFLISSLAQKGFYLKIEPVLERNLNALKQFISNYRPEEAEKVYEELSEERKLLVVPIRGSKEDRLRWWKEESYEKNSYFPENLKYETEQGEMVRSKSEVIIANILYQHRKEILYKYERPLSLTIDGFKKIIYPDFTILNIRTGKLVYWEHAGMMDDPEYANDFVKKSNMYMRSGLIPGEDVFFTYETLGNPLEISIIRQIADRISMMD